MRAIVRSVGAVLLAALVAGLVILAVELLGTVIAPLPSGVDPRDAEAVEAAMADAPTGALLLVLLGWILGTFAGALVAARTAGRSPIVHGLVLGTLLLAGGVYNLVTIPRPAWFRGVALLLFLPAAYLGSRLAVKGSGSEPLAPA